MKFPCMILLSSFLTPTLTLFLLLAITSPSSSSPYVIPRAFRPVPTRNSYPVCRKASTLTRSGEQQDSAMGNDDDGEENDNNKSIIDEEDIDFLFEEPEIPYENLNAMEKVWRHAKKPLLRIGSKGATHSHGNSLRQLLDDHTVVKVKVNTKKFGSLQNAYETLRDLAVENGAPEGIEMIQMRESDKMILFGMPGTLKMMKEGSFPPPPLSTTPASP